MAARDPLADFVRDALSAGRDRAAIREALTGAGWTAAEADEALSAWAEAPFSPPIPAPRPHVTAADAFFYAVMFTALGFAAWNIVVLAHGLIDLALPAGRPGWREGAGAIRWALAVLVVAGPIYLFCLRRAAGREGRERSAVRKWLIYAALFISAFAFLGDVVAVIYAFLSGDATLRFLLKAAVVAAVSAGVFAAHRRTAEGP